MKPEEYNHIIYDIEVYKNIFTCVIYSAEHDEYLTYEVSKRRNDFEKFCHAMETFAGADTAMVGFNNLGYDYPVIHALIKLGRKDDSLGWKEVTKFARDKSDAIINTSFENRFVNIIWNSDQILKQIDLFKIHHFDNVNRATSLKALEFARRSHDVGDLPFDVDHKVEEHECDELLRYNKHDVEETYGFYLDTLKAIEFRKEMGDKMSRDFTNHNDTKIGKDIFTIELENALGKEACFEWIDGKRKVRQTPRSSIAIDEILFNYVDFKQPQFQEVVAWFRRQVISETKGVLTEIPLADMGMLAFYADLTKKKGKIKNLNCIYKGIQFDFGTGGLHACIESGTYVADEEYAIIDLDVTSYYPSLAIENTVYPAHLGSEFCDIYRELKERRMSYDKGTPENAALKLALNGVYGDSNNQYSPFYDPQYTMAITINGQLLLCMLSEWVMNIKGLQFLQANTDGITVRIPRKKIKKLNKLRAKWEKKTGLQLEDAEYSHMWIRDVNNYSAQYVGGGVKRKGCYEYNVGWHQNHSQKVVAMAAEAWMLHGADIEEFIKNHDDPFDFYILAKCDRSCRLVLRTEDGDEELQRNNRYYASTEGGNITKIMKPLGKKWTKTLETELTRLGVTLDEEATDYAKYCMANMMACDYNDIADGINIKESDELGRSTKYKALNKNARLDLALDLFQPKIRESGISKNSLVTIHNTVDEMVNVNYDYYINETQKLIDPLK